MLAHKICVKPPKACVLSENHFLQICSKLETPRTKHQEKAWGPVWHSHGLAMRLSLEQEIMILLSCLINYNNCKFKIKMEDNDAGTYTAWVEERKWILKLIKQQILAWIL